MNKKKSCERADKREMILIFETIRTNSETQTLTNSFND